MFRPISHVICLIYHVRVYDVTINHLFVLFIMLFAPFIMFPFIMLPSVNMVKVLLLSFEQCFDPFTMLLVEEFPETGLYRHLSKLVFQSPSVQKYISYESHRFFENGSKLNINLQNAKEKLRKDFFFLRYLYPKMLR